MDPLYKKILPDCSILPSRDDKDHSFCNPLGIPGKVKAVRSSVQSKLFPEICVRGGGGGV